MPFIFPSDEDSPQIKQRANCKLGNKKIKYQNEIDFGNEHLPGLRSNYKKNNAPLNFKQNLVYKK